MSRSTLVDRARAARGQGCLDGAAQLFAAALSELTSADVLRTRATATEYVGLAGEYGVLCKARGDLDVAHKLYTAAWAVLQACGATEGVLAATVLRNLAAVMHAKGRAADAEALAGRAVEIRARVCGSDHLDAVADRAARAAILVDLGRIDEAEADLTHCLAEMRARGAGGRYDVAAVLHNLATIAARRDDIELATDLLEQAIEIKQRNCADDDPRLAVSRRNLARIRELL